MDLLADLRYALRVLRKTPVFAVAAIGTLALGIGANTTIYSLVQAVLLRPLPYSNPDQLVMVWEDATAAGFPRNTPAPGNYNDWRVMNRSFSDMAATRFASTSLTMDGAPEQVLGRGVSANFFDVLGVRPPRGRGFARGEDVSGAKVVVISDALWRRRYASDPGIVGRTILMSGVSHEVIGVAPRSFVFLSREIDYWVPMQLSPEQASTRETHFLTVVARLRPGVSVEAADGDMRSIARRLGDQFPETNRGLGAVVVPIREEVLGDRRVQVIALMAAAMAIVLIACANLASLTLARASARQGEYAVRLSLGATRPGLARQVVVEAMCVAIAGGTIGLIFPLVTEALLERIVPVGLPIFETSILDWRLLAFAAGLSILTALLFSVGPAFQSSRTSTAEVLQHYSRGNVSRPTRNFRDGLVILQVAATLVLLVGAGLMLRTLANLNAVPLGFDPNNLLTMQVALPQAKYADPATRLAFFERVIDDLRTIPGVQGAAFGSFLPFQSAGNTRVFEVEGQPVAPGTPLPTVAVPDALFRVVTSDYLLTLRVVPVEGRLLDDRDGADAPPAIVVNATLVRGFLGGRPALGQRIRFAPDEPWFTIVGVVEDVLERGYELDPKPGVYIPATQTAWAVSNLVMRVAGDPLDYATAAQKVIRAVDPDQPTRLVRSMTDVIGLTVGDRRQHTTLLIAFGGLALLIASLGLYGLLAQTVAARGREIGIRMALGATWRGVMTMVMSRGLVLTFIGAVVGALLAWSATRAMETLLYGVRPGDPLTFATVIALLGTVAGGACAIPALRAARIDPMQVLRDQ